MDLMKSEICANYLDFQEKIKSLRKIDDDIIYEINRAIPTKSFAHNLNMSNKCGEIYKKLSDNYKERENVIKDCIIYNFEEITRLKNKNEETETLKKIRDLQMGVRLMQNEFNIDEIIKDRTLQGKL
ncbi:unnamed protein product [Gordionus sp. m RMFG-2023]